jgi:hypothetical protein
MAKPLLVASMFVAMACNPRMGRGLYAATSVNFSIVGASTSQAGQRLAADCERHRAQLVRFWYGDAGRADWRVKCVIVLHHSEASYLREVGGGGSTTVGSSLVDVRQREIISRRIDLRCTRGQWREAIPHELTHVILADRFQGKALPRWADEGMAILADSPDKRDRHANDFRQALQRRAQFRLVELLGMQEYPAAARWGCFYGQSAAIVSYLVERKSPGEFLRFVELSTTRGTSHALRTVYGIASTAELEADWLRDGSYAKPPLSGIAAVGLDAGPARKP